ncbi:hypothetical protein KUF71_007606 [Frankliniella fusca]|uniref:Uncharacterized protein n=1 Tax=Frankliniella fusca TaxID=407009 RepID=A0AAE1LGT6_9NEOP|nr:hypothetical protein KUF71_007606 [Frankliniella fusca]
MDPVKQTNTEIEQGPNNNAQLLSDTSDNKASGLCDNTQTTKITETKNTPLQDQSNTAQNIVPQDQADQESTFWDEFPIQNNSNNDPHNTTSDNRETIKTKPPSHHTTLPMDSGRTGTMDPSFSNKKNIQRIFYQSSTCLDVTEKIPQWKQSCESTKYFQGKL